MHVLLNFVFKDDSNAKYLLYKKGGLRKAGVYGTSAGTGVVHYSDREVEVLYSFLLERNNWSNGILKFFTIFKWGRTYLL